MRVILLDGAGAGVVGGQRQFRVAVVAIDQAAGGSARRRGCSAPGSNGSATPYSVGGCRHQLHQPHRALSRDGARVPAGLGLNHRADREPDSARAVAAWSARRVQFGASSGRADASAPRGADGLVTVHRERRTRNAGRRGLLRTATSRPLFVSPGVDICPGGDCRRQPPRRRPEQEDAGPRGCACTAASSVEPGTPRRP